VIVGDGAQRPLLEQRSRELGLTPATVQFRGSQVVSAPVYRAADVLVLTSDNEGTPNVVMEAMASGLPVVASRVGGVPELVRDGETGFVLAADDEEGMAAKLQRLIGDRDLRERMGRQARRYMESFHALNRLPGYLGSLYQAVLS
jgi:glycosyltransferase involved in cell wall biosynthesis